MRMRIQQISLMLLVLLMAVAPAYAQSVTVTGKITDAETGQLLEGVTVTVKGGRSTVTDEKGIFSLNVLSLKEASLICSYIGYINQSIRLNGRSNVNVQLFPAKSELETVVVSGYAKAKRREEVVGAITTVTAKDLLADRPIESFDKMLEGLAAGVQVQTNTELGTPVKINIRGQNTLTSLVGSSFRSGAFVSTQPLFVIDGVPITEQRAGDEPIAFGGEAFKNPLANINPDDIESISILKDAAATSIYGANASNGVVIITTKKGKVGRTKFSMSVNAGITNPINRIKWLSGPQYHGLVKELYLNEGMSPAQAEALAGSSEIDTDWFGITNRTGAFQNYDIELSGGSDKQQFRMSGSFLNQQSIQLGNDLQKGYLRLRLDNKLHEKVSLTTSLAPSITRQNSLTVYSELTPIVPNIPTYNADGTFYTINGVPNPVAVLNQNEHNSEGGALNGNIRLDYQALPTLRISGNLGTDIQINKQSQWFSPLNETGANVSGRAVIYDRTVFSWIAFAQANWTPKLGDKHHLDVIAGAEATSENTRLLRGNSSEFSYYRLQEISNGARQSAASSKQIRTANSTYLQTSYNWRDKYFITGSGRIDASSVFGTDINTTLNGAVGVGWNILKENWMINHPHITSMRIRGSYGTTGNSRIGGYEARGLYSINGATYNGQTSSDPVSLPNPDLGWEKSYKTNIGFDIGFWKRLNFSVDVYRNLTRDAISTIDIPYENGFGNMLANTSSLENKGIDMSINAQVVTAKNFQWSATVNMGFNRNKILSVNNGAQRFGSNEMAVALREGYSTAAIWGFKWLGVDPQTGVELFEGKDGKTLRADDPTIGLFDIQNASVIGDRLPDLQGGIINNLSWKGLTMNILFTYSIGGQALANYRNEWNGNNLDNRNQSVNLLDRWQKPGDITNIPKLNRQARSGYRFVMNSSRFMYEETFLKLSALGLQYQLPAKTFKWMGASKVQVFVNATNLWYWYKNDAPSNRNGLRQYRFTFPEAQGITGGAKFNW